MRASFLATVRGVSETDTSGFCGGAHAVEFYITGKAPIGEVHRRVTLPLFDAEQARELATVYHKSGAVRITVEMAEGGAGMSAPEVRQTPPRSGACAAVWGCCALAKAHTPAALMPYRNGNGGIEWEIRSGSDSRVRIQFCPWCGFGLPERLGT